MTGPGCGWSKISRVRAPYDNLDPAVKPLQSPESAVYIMDSLLGLTGCAEDNEAAINEQAAKTRADSIPADKVSPPFSSQAEWAKRNAGLNPASSSNTGVMPKRPAPAAGKN